MWEPSAAQSPSEAGQQSGEATPETQGRLVVETRFGALEFGAENRVYMPLGLLGFSDHHNFGIADLPQPELAAFKLLQCLEDTSLSFIVNPLKIDEGRVAREDLEDAALSVGIPVEAAAFLLIVTLRQADQGLNVTVNLRAPVVIDVNRALARQVVMANSAYPIQQPLTLGQGAAG
ncbi:MAG: flagellar assembly protein FliW [Kiloniellales bacterium]|nr:flagellar assembly protein FliW [Kiloniellales bacterium]